MFTTYNGMITQKSEQQFLLKYAAYRADMRKWKEWALFAISGLSRGGTTPATVLSHGTATWPYLLKAHHVCNYFHFLVYSVSYFFFWILQFFKQPVVLHHVSAFLCKPFKWNHALFNQNLNLFENLVLLKLKFRFWKEESLP